MNPVERGPNYDWKHEAEHYRDESDKLREILHKVVASRDSYAAQVARLTDLLADIAHPKDCTADEDGDRCNHCRAFALLDELDPQGGDK